MEEQTSAFLLNLNRAFYARFADEFAATRRGWPPGFQRILPHLRPAANVLDLGCGNGRLLLFLLGQGWHGRYIGADSSPELLAIAQANAAKAVGARASFLRTELADLRPSIGLPFAREAAFEAIACLATLHHIPGAVRRARLIAECGRLLAVEGVLIVSTWQFTTAPRLRERILPWSAVGLREEDVEPGDYLLAWGPAAAGQRYCAAIGEEDLNTLAANAGLICVTTFYADGHEGNLGLYGVYRRPASRAGEENVSAR